MTKILTLMLRKKDEINCEVSRGRILCVHVTRSCRVNRRKNDDNDNVMCI